jgi:hypothetical protein
MTSLYSLSTSHSTTLTTVYAAMLCTITSQFKNMNRRTWEMTYLDPDFRILYGRQEGDKSPEGRFIFILQKVKDAAALDTSI